MGIKSSEVEGSELQAFCQQEDLLDRAKWQKGESILLCH